jgi:hypothetical protein
MNPHGFKVGSVVYDRFYDLPAMVADFQGPLICLTRPSGFSWRSRWIHVRPATAYERRQLRAIAKLGVQNRRGVAPA